MSAYALDHAKDAHIVEKAARPVYNTKALGAWNAKAIITNVQFKNFKIRSSCKARQSAIGLPDNYQPDITPIHYFYNTKFTNVQFESIAYFRDPPLSWATINDCGEFPCTGSLNSVWNFYDAVFEAPDGITPLPTFWTQGTTTKYNF